MPTDDQSLVDSYQQLHIQRQGDKAAAELDAVFPPEFRNRPMEIEVIGGHQMTVPGELTPRRPSDDPLGRLQPKPEDESTAGTVARNVAEIPGAALQGAHDALYNATAFVDPLAGWLDENVAKLGTYEIGNPKTATGGVVKSVSQFLTGFIPAVKGLKAAGIENGVANPMLAGAISDFATRDGHDGRLADMVVSLGLPDEWRIKFLETDQESPELIERFKNALEGVGLGMVVDGALMAARLAKSLIRANKDINGPGSEIAILKEKYGNLTDEDIAKHLGDPTKPMVETHIVQPPAVGGKIKKAEGELPAFEPRAVIRTTKKSQAEPITKSPEAMPEALRGTSLVDESGKPIKMFHATYKDFADISTKKGKLTGEFQIDVLNKLGAHFGSSYESIQGVFDSTSESVRASGKYWSEVNSIPGLDDVGTFAPGANVRPVYLNVKKPFDIGSEDNLWPLSDGAMPDRNAIKEMGTSDPSVMEEIFSAALQHPDSPTKAASAIKKVLASKGYDGISYTGEMVDIKGHKAYIAFDDSQIVSAFDERAVIRTTKKSQAEPVELAGHKTTELGDVILTNSAKEPGKYQITFFDGPAGKSNTVKDAVFDTPEQALKEFNSVSGKTVVEPVVPKSGVMKSEDFETYINFARIDEPEQVKFTIGKMAEAMKGSVDEARRGKITQEETAKMADDLGMTVPELLERRKGQPFNAEEALAARQLWAASGEQLLAAAKKAASPNAGDLDQFAFRRAMAVHAAIQNEVIGARTETARALAAWKIPAGGGVEKARAIKQVMDAAGGPNEARDMARRLAILAVTGAQPAAIARFVSRGWGAKSADIIKEVWVNGLLSSPKTHVVNIMSNSGVVMQQIYERAVAGGIRGLVGGDGVKASESIAMAYGLLGSVKDAFRMAAKSLKTGETGYAFNKIDVTHPNSISSEAFDLASNTGMGRFVDFIGHTATIPGRLLGGEDEFFKTIGYRMEVHAQAMRQATNEGLTGDAAWVRMQELVQNPPEHIRINAADAAMYSTFTNEVGWFGKAVMNLRDSGSPGGQLGVTLVLPFVRTPTNIARYTFERTPFAPLVGQWRADIAAGGARADLALARMSTGTAIMLTAMDWADSGALSGAGPSDPDQREALVRQGWQPYSMRVGDRWYSYNRADPFGSTMGFAASISEALSRGEVDQEDVDEWQEVMAMTIAAVSQVTINKTYLEGVANVTEVMSDPKRYSEGYVNDLVASFVPFTSLASAVETAVDPTQREATSPWEAAQARIVGLSKNLPPRRNLWGEEIRTESGLGRVYDFVSPITSRPEDITPVDREIVRLQQGPQRIKKRTMFDGVQVSMKNYPDVYDEYVRLAGNDLKHPAWGLGAKDYLNQVVTGKHAMSVVYGMLSDENRRDFIENTVRDYRKLAQRQILEDPRFMKFAAEVQYIKAAQQRSEFPVLGE